MVCDLITALICSRFKGQQLKIIFTGEGKPVTACKDGPLKFSPEQPVGQRFILTKATQLKEKTVSFKGVLSHLGKYQVFLQGQTSCSR